MIRAKWLLSPCWCSQSACTVHRASFLPLQSQTGYLQRCPICLSHTALPDRSGRSFSLPDLFPLHHNTTELFHTESTTCFSEVVKHFLFLICRSTNPHTRTCPETPRRRKAGRDVQPAPRHGLQRGRSRVRQRLAPRHPPVLDSEDQLVEPVHVLEASLVRHRVDYKKTISSPHVLLPHCAELLLARSIQN